MNRVSVFMEWIFKPHGYLNWYEQTPIFGQRLTSIMEFGAYYRKKKIHYCKCKMCGRQFKATKKQPTCQALSCYMDYRLNGNKKKKVNNARVYK